MLVVNHLISFSITLHDPHNTLHCSSMAGYESHNCGEHMELKHQMDALTKHFMNTGTKHMRNINKQFMYLDGKHFQGGGFEDKWHVQMVNATVIHSHSLNNM